MEGAFECGHDGGCGVVEEVVDSVAWDTDASAFKGGGFACFDIVRGLFERLSEGPIVEFVLSGHGRKEISSVFHGLGNRSYTVLAKTDRDDHASGC